MTKIEKTINTTFESGSVRDALIFLSTCIRNAFPEFNFRGIEVVRLVTGRKVIEGKSWNHDFIIRAAELDGAPVWSVTCHRTSHGETTDKKVFLDAKTLEILQ